MEQIPDGDLPKVGEAYNFQNNATALIPSLGMILTPRFVSATRSALIPPPFK